MIDQKSFTYSEQPKKAEQNSASPSSNDSSFQDFIPGGKTECVIKQDCPESRQTLTPVSDINVGELILISGEEEMPQDIITVNDSDNASVESLLSLKLDSSNLDGAAASLSAVEQVKEINSGLRTKLKTLTSQHKEEKNKLQNQLQALTR